MKSSISSIPNSRLRELREQRHLTQTELARQLGSTYLSVCRWENGTTSPSLFYRRRLCEFFGLTLAELGFASSSPKTTPTTEELHTTSTQPWLVPHRRNPFFTGREEILSRLHTLLSAEHSVVLGQVYAISGLGGIGKTQAAVEYAYRYRSNYDAILWLRAENQEVLEADIVGLAQALCLPEHNDHQYSHILNAVQRWLHTNSNWLLVFDNVEHISLVEQVLPTDHQGCILLTTRSQSTGAFTHCLDLAQMEPEEGALFLLRRAKLLSSDTALAASSFTQTAQNISQLLDGLPLALDQVGAYIEETGCSLADYLQRYQEHRALLLNRRGLPTTDHPSSVSATLALSFEMVERSTPSAIELLRFCAFLSPDAIPEALMRAGSLALGPELHTLAANPLALDEAFAALRRYSLLRRHAESHTFTIHRLVQAVLKEQMSAPLQQQWATRCICAINHCLPSEDVPSGQSARYLLSHARTCVALIDEYHLVFPEAAQLLSKTGRYLVTSALYPQAEQMLKQALALQEMLLEPSNPDTAATLNTLALLYYYVGRYVEAEPLYLRALAIREQTLGSQHTDTANTLDWLGMLYVYQGRYVEAEPVFLRARAIKEQTLGFLHMDTGATINNLALLYMHQQRYEEAEPLYQSVLALHEHMHSSEHLYHAIALDNLAKLYYHQARYEEASALYQQALAIEAQTVGLQHPSAAITTSNLAQVYHAQGDFTQAEQLYQQAIACEKDLLGSDYPGIAYILANLARLYQDQGQHTLADSLYRQALSLKEQHLGLHHPSTIETREWYTGFQEQCR